MVAKKLPKKSTPSKNTKQEESDEEDYEVADLSAIPAPQVEFVMPNLTPLESGKVSKVNKPNRTAKKKAPSRENGDVLTANELNNEIVRLRPVVQKARGFLTKRLIRKLKRMETIVAKKPSEPLKRKIQRFEEEIHAIKDLSKDEVTKFALLNKKTLDQLGITDKTSANDRCLFKLVCEPHLVKAVEDYRARYPSWEVTMAYLLQRLGLQYASIDKATEKLLHASLAPDSGEAEGDDKQKAAAKATPTSSKLEKGAKAKKVAEVLKKAQAESEESEASDAEASDEVGDMEGSGGSSEDDEEGSEDDNEEEEEEEENVEFGSDSNDDEEQAAANRRKLLLGTAEKSRASPKAKKRPNEDKLVKKGLKRSAKVAKIEPPPTVVVKQVKLSEGGKIEVAKPTVAAAKVPAEIPQDDDEEEEEEGHTSFFLPASAAIKLDRERSEAKKSDAAGNASTKPKKAKLAEGKTGEVMSKKKKNIGMKGGKLKKHEKGQSVHSKLKPAGDSAGKLPQKTSYSGPKLFPEPKKAPMSKNKEGIMRPKKVVGKNVGEANKWEKISLHKQPAHVKSKQPQDSTDQLHPSWAARRLAKEKQGLAPQGKRIVFGDD